MQKRMKTVSFKLPQETDEALDQLARRRRSSRSAIIRAALDAFSKENAGSVTVRAGKLVGSLSGPSDLATNPKHMADFGK